MNKKSSIKALALPYGIQELLESAGFTPESISSSTSSELAQALGIDIYIARLITHETKRAIGNNNEYILSQS